MAIEFFLFRLKEKIDLYKNDSLLGNKEGLNPIKKQTNELTIDSKKDKIISDLKDTINIIESKIKKMTVLVKIKDEKINLLSKKLIEKGYNIA